MEQLIPVVNRLQDAFNSIGLGHPIIDLPQIVVIGSQSSGKSSVLENIVGKGFLPRGSGICTRRPLVLQMHHTPNDTEEYAEFLHVRGKFTDFEQVRREIELETERETGKNKGVSNKAIRLKIYSPNVLNLTLVDLPGITKVPIGDQPLDIEKLIRSMCLEYVSNPMSIILAVSPANVDLANSDAIKLAKQVDPNGDRTIGILTKLDLVDAGVDAFEALTGKVIPLKKGYIGIINRSQAEINANSSIKELRQKEKAFFLNHPAYRSIAARQGTDFLSKTLNTILMTHIRDHLPELKANVQKQFREVDRELNALGSHQVDLSDRTAMGQVILSLLGKYSNNFVNSIEGRQPSEVFDSSFATQNGLCGGALISRAFKRFSDSIDALDTFHGLSDSDISMAILNATGPRPSLFVPELSFEALVKRQLVLLKEPALNCVMEVFEIVHQVADQSCFSGLNRFQMLQGHIMESMQRLLSEHLMPTQSMVENLIRIEQAFINTSHPSFANMLNSIRHHAPETSVPESSIPEPPAHSRTGSLSSAASDPGKSVGDDLVADEDQESLSESKRPNFMSFIFNERVADPPPPSTFRKLMNTPPLHPKTTFSQNTEGDMHQVKTIKQLIECYLSICRSNIKDLTPKTIMHFLVNKLKESVHTELIRSLYKEDLFSNLLQEDEQIAIHRASFVEQSKLLTNAMSILNEVREYKS